MSRQPSAVSLQPGRFRAARDSQGKRQGFLATLGMTRVEIRFRAGIFRARERKGRDMSVAIESMAIEMPEVLGHPNRAGFRGVLTMLDVPSDRPPAGARGHRVLLTRAAAEAALPSLLGMGLDYTPGLDRHDVRRKVGVITEANIVPGRGEESGPGSVRGN